MDWRPKSVGIPLEHDKAINGCESSSHPLPGIIGYITPETSFLSNPGPDITFTHPVVEVRKVAQDLKENQQVDIIVAVGHAGELL